LDETDSDEMDLDDEPLTTSELEFEQNDPDVNSLVSIDIVESDLDEEDFKV
jgi:hypothetical protein